MGLQYNFFEQTNAGQSLSPFLDATLRDYIRSICPQKGFGSDISNASKDILLKGLSLLLPKTIAAEKRDWAIDSFAQTPMMQLADGSSLLYDPETFLTNYMFQVAAGEANIPFLFAQQCSRSRMTMDPKNHIGSGYLDLQSDIYSVFGLSKSKLSRFSVATLNTPLCLTFNPLGIRQPAYTNQEMPDLLSELKGQNYPSASEAFLQANAHIWAGLNIKAKKRLVQFDERLTALVVALHIEDPHSPINKILFDPDVRQSFLSRRERVVNSEDNVLLKSSTDFFYFNQKGSLQPLTFMPSKADTTEHLTVKGQPLPFSFTPENVAQELRRGNLFPDLALSYAVLSILPGCLAFGGASQHEYLPLIKKIMEETHAQTPFLSEPIPEMIQQDALAGSRMISGLIEMSPRIKNMVAGMNKETDFTAFESEYMEMPLQETLGSLSYYDYLRSYIAP